MYRLTQAQPGQMPEILAFAERAFAAQEKGPDFARMLPKLYGRGRATESEHPLLYNGDVPEGMYALRVLDAKAAGEPVEVKYVLDLRDFSHLPYGNKFVSDFSVIENDPEVTVSYTLRDPAPRG